MAARDPTLDFDDRPRSAGFGRVIAGRARGHQ
jgi:hypothetical protein